MSDFFDQLERELRHAAGSGRHLPWYMRMRLPVRRRGVLLVLVGLVIAAPAVGAASGWFSTGQPDRYYPASATSGLGKVLSGGDRLLPIRVADPDGGPSWGIRLVHTTRGDTCIQVGRVQGGQIGALGIDNAWHDDHEFHEIKPNDQLADICGATDAAGNGFVNESVHGAPANVDVPLGNGRHLAAPAHSMRMVFAGLLGPDAKSITYKTPSGQTRTEATSGGVGAYLIVFRQTDENCSAYERTLLFRVDGCGDSESGDLADLREPTAVTNVAYDNGRTCSVEPSARLASAYRAFEKRMRARFEKEPSSEARTQEDRFFAAHGVSPRNRLTALVPECKPVGWVAPTLPRLTQAQVTAPIKLKTIIGKRFCNKRADIGTFDGAVVCDRRVPRGDRFFYGTLPPRPMALVSVTFTARQRVTSSNSYYALQIGDPNGDGQGNHTQKDIRAGQRVTFSWFEDPDARGVYRGKITFEPNVGQAGSEEGPIALRGQPHALTVGRFSFRLPVPKRR